MFNTDRNIAWKRKRQWIPCNDWLNGANAAGINVSQITNRKVQGAGIGVGTAFISAGAGSGWPGFVPIPFDANPEFPLGFTLLWTHSYAGSTASTLTMAITQNIFLNSVIIPTASAATALTTPITAKTLAASNTAFIPVVSSRGILAANWMGKSNLLTPGLGAMLQFFVACSALSGGGLALNTDNVWWLGLWLDYVPMRTRFPHSEQDAPLDDAIQ